MTEPNVTAALRGDFSRIRFDPSKSYTTVLSQQGRVALDADANEQCFIDAYQSGIQLVDVVGEYGGPADSYGFQITVPSPQNNDILIGAGRYYVEGLLCENQPPQNQATISYEKQPYLITAPGTAASDLLNQLQQPENAGKVLQVSLQVWQRLQTALDDRDLLEPAIGTADTTARLQTVWRVLAELVDPHQPTPQVRELPGTMTASTAAAATDCGCGPVAAAGYQGLENQLYRVEIHTGGDLTDATFMWSRENGSVVVAVTTINQSTVTVSSLGPDANLGFQVGQWVELTDDTNEFGNTPSSPGLNTPGTLYQIASIQPADPSVTLTLPPGTQIAVQTNQNARMRRWDQSGPSATQNGIALSTNPPIQLENGIQVQFSPGTYQSGDYWTIPARTATGQIDWPQDESVPPNPVPVSPTSIEVYSAPLATVSFVSGQIQCHDERTPFSPLTALAPPPTPQAIHVVGISWVNDAVTTVDQLVAHGITITLDTAPTSPITPANFVVTIEDLAQAAPTDTLTILRYPATVNYDTTASDETLTWTLPPRSFGRLIDVWYQRTIEALNNMVSPAANVPSASGAPPWALVRVRLLGAMIYALNTAGQPVYLDGQALCDPNPKSTTGLILPSGSGAVASDFEGWFHLAPTLQIANMTLNPPSVTVEFDPQNNNNMYVVATGTPAPVSPNEAVLPSVTVKLNYNALTDTTIQLALTPAATTPSTPVVATLQATTVTISAGAESAFLDINIVGNPGVSATGAANTYTYTVTASIPGSLTSATFTVIGAAPPIPPPR